MIRPTTLILFVLSVVSAAALFGISFEVSALEERLVALNKDITRDRNAIHVLKAEWSYLNQPERLDGLTRRHLELKPLEGTQLSDLSTVPLRPAPESAPVSLPEATEQPAPTQTLAGLFKATPKLKPSAPPQPARHVQLASQRTTLQPAARPRASNDAALDASLRAILGNAGGRAR